MPAKINLLGQRFGRLLVRKEIKSIGYGAQWRCDCDCGNQVDVAGCHLRHGTNSCGCLRLEHLAKGRRKGQQANTKHGHSARGHKSRVYNSWTAMIQRCTNPNFKHYKNYGGRGIKVCKRWLDFEKFLVDMGEKPIGLTLDRINNSGNYTPKNCRWTTWTVQNNNRRKPKETWQFRNRNKAGQFA